MKKQYRTAEVAAIIDIHPNTVRLYEDCGFITKPERTNSGYRIFTELHIYQLRLTRAAMQVEILQNGLRKQIINIVRLAADCKVDEAVKAVEEYIVCIHHERKNAEEALVITEKLLQGIQDKSKEIFFTRKQAAEHLGVTTDTLRNWELNGLFAIKRKQNGYRAYTQEDLKYLKVIRSLRCANYSLSAILRLLKSISIYPDTDMREVIDTPSKDDDIVTACDQLLTSLDTAEKNALWMISQLEEMKKLTSKEEQH